MRFLQGILLSLLVHLLLVLSLQYFAQIVPKESYKPITVEIIPSQNETKEREKQIVREALAPDKVKAEESQDPIKFLSAQTQRVKQQTQALLNGMTKNRAHQMQKTLQDQKQETPRQRPRLHPQVQGNLDAFTPNYRKMPSHPQDIKMDQGLSTLGEALPKDVAVGSFTALNTDRYLYYSFYARIEELIRFRWETMVTHSIESTPPENFKTNISGLWNTLVEIWLKPTGEFHSAHLMKESGFRAFDQAAVQAFMQARVFPNPPKEMVESDGYIHLKYGFQVRYEPKVLVKSRE